MLMEEVDCCLIVFVRVLLSYQYFTIEFLVQFPLRSLRSRLDRKLKVYARVLVRAQSILHFECLARQVPALYMSSVLEATHVFFISSHDVSILISGRSQSSGKY